MVDPSQAITLVHPGGARLKIAQGALTEPTRVTIRRRPWQLDFGAPSFPVGRPFEIDLGGAGIQQGAQIQLALRYPDDPFEQAPLRPDHLLLGYDDGAGNVWLRPVDRDFQRREITTNVADYLRIEEGQSDSTTREFMTYFVLPVTLLQPSPILQVPYYSQDDYPYCSPTSLAMALNFHVESVVGRASNWHLAALHDQDETEGAWPYEIMEDIDATDDLYYYHRWDADLIPTNPFTSYVKAYTSGFNLAEVLGDTFGGVYTIPSKEIPPRPVQLVSEKRNHAFLAVGTDDESIWVHDSFDTIAPSPSIAFELTWDDFAFKTVLEDAREELHTMVLTASPRPAEQRRGSIELLPSSFVVSYGSPGVTAHWIWDGDPWEEGYHWFEEGDALTDDSVLGNLLPLSLQGEPATLSYSIGVDNVTAFELTYSLVVAVQDASTGKTLFNESYSVTEPAYTRGRPHGDSVALPNVVPGSGEYLISLFLYQDGVSQDTKVVRFAIE